MWPEYKQRRYDYREVLGLDGETVFDRMGNTDKVRSYNDLIGLMAGGSNILFVSSLPGWKFLYEFTSDRRNKVICNQRGKPLLVRAGYGIRTGSFTWIVSSEAWNSILDPTFLTSVSNFFDYARVGTAPSLSSIGHRLMKKCYWESVYSVTGKRHTALPLACEKFIVDTRIGGIVQTPGKGCFYPELLEMDMSSAYLSTFVELPSGTAVRTYGIECWKYPAFYVKCSITITEDLPLGPFPVRKEKKGLVNWPTKKGTYDAYLWRFQILDAIKAGCIVSISNGWSWPELCTDNLQWCKYMHRLRERAQTDEHEKYAKIASVGGIGHHAMERNRYELTTDNKNNTGKCVVDVYGVAYDLWVVDDVDTSSAYMVHWNSWCLSMCNSVLYNAALPYANQGRLVALDYDAMLIIEEDESHRYIKKRSIEALRQPPGTFMWTKLHDVTIHANRSYSAIEHSKRPGIHQTFSLDKELAMLYT